jgi:hypothetical protein
VATIPLLSTAHRRITSTYRVNGTGQAWQVSSLIVSKQIRYDLANPAAYNINRFGYAQVKQPWHFSRISATPRSLPSTSALNYFLSSSSNTNIWYLSEISFGFPLPIFFYIDGFIKNTKTTPFVASSYSFFGSNGYFFRIDYFIINLIITMIIIILLTFTWVLLFPRRNEMCMSCNYDLTGVIMSQCPECGKAR